MSREVSDDFSKQTVTELAKGVGYRCSNPECRRATIVKSFGRREAYESLRGTNPRAADNGLWVFLFSAERGEVTTGSDLRWT
jgi:hypothetical protein